MLVVRGSSCVLQVSDCSDVHLGYCSALTPQAPQNDPEAAAMHMTRQWWS